MIHRFPNGCYVRLAGAVVVALFTVVLPRTTSAQTSPQDGSNLETNPAAPIQVGTYNPQRAFEVHPSKANLDKAMEAAQQQMQQAQQSGDQQQMYMVQQQLDQSRRQALDEFRQTVNTLFPQIASTAGMQIGAMLVTYMSDSVGSRDLTGELIDAISHGPKDPPSDQSEARPMPITLGTYDADSVFRSHPAYAEMVNAAKSAQAELQQAQATGDRTTLQRILEEQKQSRSNAMSRIQTDLNAVLSKVAKAAGVDVTALEVVYAVDGVTTKDITGDLIKALKGGSE